MPDRAKPLWKPFAMTSADTDAEKLSHVELTLHGVRLQQSVRFLGDKFAGLPGTKSVVIPKNHSLRVKMNTSV